MTFSQFLGILRARMWVFLATLLVTVGVAIAVSLLLPKSYTAVTTVVVDFKGMDPVMGMPIPIQLMPGYLATQVDIIQSPRVAVQAIRKLRITENPIAKQQWQQETKGVISIEDWYAEILLKKLDVRPSRDSSVLYISYEAADPGFAAAVANAFAEAYQKVNLELRVEPARQSAAWFDERLQQLRKKLEEAQARLSAHLREKGFTAQDERLDLESNRLNELSLQYTSAQGQAADATSRQRQVNDFLARGASLETLPDVLVNGLIQNLKAQLTLTEGRLQQTASQLGKNHPEVKRLEADIEGQRAKLKAELSVAASGVNNSAKIAQKREADLQSQLAAQKAKLLRLNQGRDEMSVLQKDVEGAQRAFDVASQRFQQTNLESQASQTNIAILAQAVPPLEASFPKFFLNILVSLVLGTALGVALALIVEMSSRRIRSSRDLEEVTQLPVLGVLKNDRSARNRKSRWRKPESTGVTVLKTTAISG